MHDAITSVWVCDHAMQFTVVHIKAKVGRVSQGGRLGRWTIKRTVCIEEASEVGAIGN